MDTLYELDKYSWNLFQRLSQKYCIKLISQEFVSSTILSWNMKAFQWDANRPLLGFGAEGGGGGVGVRIWSHVPFRGRGAIALKIYKCLK